MAAPRLSMEVSCRRRAIRSHLGRSGRKSTVTRTSSISAAVTSFRRLSWSG
jgi:hypothetical protein